MPDTVVTKNGGRAMVLGCAIDRLDMASTVDRICRAIERGQQCQQVSVNAAKLVAMQEDVALREFVQGCEIVNADGQAVVWASRILGDPLPERVAGIDLMAALLSVAERHAYGVYILGARAEVLDAAVTVLMGRHPALRIVGRHHGYFTAEEEGDIAEQVRILAPDMLFVAMSTPKKERWLGSYGRSLGVPFRMGVGGSVDVIAGVTTRAPQAWQKVGMEWAYRLIQEPRRMWRRYLDTNTRFILLLGRAMLARVARR